MEKIAKLFLSAHLKSFLLLTKPGIIMGNVLTAVGGFALASKGAFDCWLFLAMIEGLAFIIGSACVYNNVIDIELDKKMERTQNRPLPKGVISRSHALIFAAFLGLIGVLILAIYTNLLTLMVALAGFIVYVTIYSFSKYKTSQGTLIGSFAGAIPPVVGYTAAAHRIDLAASILFLMIALWQMPHFYAIAIFRLKDYEKGSIPILPLKKGMLHTKIQMIFYCLAFMVAGTLLTFFDYMGSFYFIVVGGLGLAWLLLAIQGLTCRDDGTWARKMFFFSLAIVMAVCTLIPLT